MSKKEKTLQEKALDFYSNIKMLTTEMEYEQMRSFFRKLLIEYLKTQRELTKNEWACVENTEIVIDEILFAYRR